MADDDDDDGSGLLDSVILQVFEENADKFSFPLTTMKQTRDFVRILNRKGFDYEAIAEEVGEKLTYFQNWRLGADSNTIGLRVLRRLNRPLQDAMLSDEEDTEKNIRQDDKDKHKVVDKVKLLLFNGQSVDIDDAEAALDVIDNSRRQKILDSSIKSQVETITEETLMNNATVSEHDKDNDSANKEDNKVKLNGVEHKVGKTSKDGVDEKCTQKNEDDMKEILKVADVPETNKNLDKLASKSMEDEKRDEEKNEKEETVADGSKTTLTTSSSKDKAQNSQMQKQDDARPSANSDGKSSEQREPLKITEEQTAFDLDKKGEPKTTQSMTTLPELKLVEAGELQAQPLLNKGAEGEEAPCKKHRTKISASCTGIIKKAEEAKTASEEPMEKQKLVDCKVSKEEKEDVVSKEVNQDLLTKEQKPEQERSVKEQELAKEKEQELLAKQQKEEEQRLLKQQQFAKQKEEERLAKQKLAKEKEQERLAKEQKEQQLAKEQEREWFAKERERVAKEKQQKLAILKEQKEEQDRLAKEQEQQGLAEQQKQQHSPTAADTQSLPAEGNTAAPPAVAAAAGPSPAASAPSKAAINLTESIDSATSSESQTPNSSESGASSAAESKQLKTMQRLTQPKPSPLQKSTSASIPATRENYDSDLDSEKEEAPSSTLVKLIDSIQLFKETQLTIDGPGFIYVLSDTSGSRPVEKLEGTHRVRIGASRYPEKRFEQAKAFNPDLKMLMSVKVSQRRGALERVEEELSAVAYRGMKGWYRGAIENILLAVTNLEGQWV